jgi:hypothetical protein
MPEGTNYEPGSPGDRQQAAPHLLPLGFLMFHSPLASQRMQRAVTAQVTPIGQLFWYLLFSKRLIGREPQRRVPRTIPVLLRGFRSYSVASRDILKDAI